MPSFLTKVVDHLSQNLVRHGNAQRKTVEWRALIADVRSRQPLNLALKGFKVYSQNDEDGIIEAIFDRLGGGQTFLEIGVEDGRECNTHYLSLKGWRGAWIEANDKYCETIDASLGGHRFPGRFMLIRDFARVDNITRHYRDVCSYLSTNDLDFFSLDIDSNDLHVMRALLESGARPVVVCVEYNGKFPPPLRVAVTFDEGRGWSGDDYFGASLQSFADVFEEFGYRLITCNVVGANAFFIRGEDAERVETMTPAEAWHPLTLHLAQLPSSHPPSMKFMRDRLNN